jgi:hypothetical protein
MVVCLHDVSMMLIGVEGAHQEEEEPPHHHVAPGMSLPMNRHSIHHAVPITLEFFICAIATLLSHTASALLVDVFPDVPSTAYASGHVMRCGFSAASAAIIDPLVQSLGRGWYFTIFALFTGTVCLVCNSQSKIRYGLAAEKDYSINDENCRMKSSQEKSLLHDLNAQISSTRIVVVQLLSSPSCSLLFEDLSHQR